MRRGQLARSIFRKLVRQNGVGCRLAIPDSNRLTGIRARRRMDHQIANHDIATPMIQPSSTLRGVTCNCRNGVPMASTHQVRRPVIISQAYPIPAAMPIAAPIAATINPSRPSNRDIRRRSIPAAASVPSSRARCSTPSWNNSAMSITADAIRKKLKPRNRKSNGVVPLAAARPCCFTGRKDMPSAFGSISLLEAVATTPAAEAASPAGNRSRLIVPQRLAHKRFAVSSDTNALGVVRYSSQ